MKRNVYRYDGQLIRSTPELSEGDQARIVRAIRFAGSQADAFAEAKGIDEPRDLTDFNVVEVFDGRYELAQALGARSWRRIPARIDLIAGVLYLSDKGCVEDIYVELGKWFFYPFADEWNREDLETAEAFGDWCEDRDEY